MATFDFYGPVNMLGNFAGSGYVTQATSGFIQVTGSFGHDNYYGYGFTYNGNTVTGGVLSSLYSYTRGDLGMAVTGMQVSAAAVASAVNRFDLPGAFLVMASGNDVIDADYGNDILHGWAGNDQILGRGGADHIWGGEGGDYIDGGLEYDYARYDSSSSGVYVRLDTHVGYSGEAQYDYLVSIEGLVGSAHADTLVGDEFTGNVINGVGGDDTIFGLGGNDTLLGGAGNDYLYGGTGGDWLDGSSGVDFARYDYAAGVDVRLYNASLNTGEAAGDTFVSVEGVVGSWWNDVICGDGGSNQLHGLGGNDWIDGLGGGDQLFGGDGHDHLVSSAWGETLDGGSGWDTVRYDNAQSDVRAYLGGAPQNNGGWAYYDTYVSIEGLVGSGFNDDLRGDANANALNGQGGHDFIVGGGGADYLNGGAGTDWFYFSAPADGGGGFSGDLIQDFVSGVDRLCVNGANFALGSPGGTVLETWRFVSGSNANLATTQFGYDSANGHVWYDVDGTGAGGQTVLATLTGVTLTNYDFLVF